jgi:hypothetical protein
MCVVLLIHEILTLKPRPSSFLTKALAMVVLPEPSGPKKHIKGIYTIQQPKLFINAALQDLIVQVYYESVVVYKSPAYFSLENEPTS